MQDNNQLTFSARYPASAVDGKKIAIVGGGPGGLTLARLPQQGGAEVVVFERDQSRNARVQGSAFDLHEGWGLAALEAAGLMEAFWANHRPDVDRLRLTDAQGNVLHDHARRMPQTALSLCFALSEEGIQFRLPQRLERASTFRGKSIAKYPQTAP
jgi:2-polyprenyl-6-methoxyphenol hydroxylase-like FAD-dependent oxidoreductase